MIKSRVVLAGGLLAMAGAAYADVSIPVAVVSDYDFRGISQTDEDPALQLGLDYDFGNGFYVGTWGSNVDFGPGDPNLEVDLYAGYAGGDAEESFAYDLGVVGYLYPGASDINMLEVYAGVTKGLFGVKAWYSPDFGGSGDSAYYLEGNVAVPLPSNFGFQAHVGWSDGDAWDAVGGYHDWSVGFSYDVSNVSFGLKYVDGDSDVVEGRVIASVSTSLPWGAP